MNWRLFYSVPRPYVDGKPDGGDWRPCGLAEKGFARSSVRDLASRRGAAYAERPSPHGTGTDEIVHRRASRYRVTYLSEEYVAEHQARQFEMFAGLP